MLITPPVVAAAAVTVAVCHFVTSTTVSCMTSMAVLAKAFGDWGLPTVDEVLATLHAAYTARDEDAV